MWAGVGTAGRHRTEDTHGNMVLQGLLGVHRRAHGVVARIAGTRCTRVPGPEVDGGSTPLEFVRRSGSRGWWDRGTHRWDHRSAVSNAFLPMSALS